jgi:hypothetical protein
MLLEGYFSEGEGYSEERRNGGDEERGSLLGGGTKASEERG